MLPTREDAVSASVSLARMLGLPVEDPVVIAEGYSVRVRLCPAPVVTRVVTIGRVLRGEPLPWLEREVAVATFLADAGAPVVAPWTDAGPHQIDGLEVSLWDWTEHQRGVVDQDVFGRLLGELHIALDGYAGELPVLVGPLTDVTTALGLSSDPVLHAAAEQLLPLALTWPRRVLHGDAHTGNVLLTPDGPRWTDFEDVCVGPVEWDLASLTLTDEAVAAYPGAADRDRLGDCRDLRRLQVLAAVLTDDVQDRSLYDRLVTALRRRL